MRERKRWPAVTDAAALAVIALAACGARALPPVNAGEDGVAVKGYDVVAYFTRGEPVEGDEAFTHEWHGAAWRFSSREHLDLFRADPEKYAPQYGGY